MYRQSVILFRKDDPNMLELVCFSVKLGRSTVLRQRAYEESLDRHQFLYVCI